MTYYNEHDPKAAAWLRELIKEGHIPAGDVDERDIQDIKPHELTRYTQQHFFAGIGGWALALRLAEWPDSRPVRTGSCPCQPFSAAGKGLAEKDERHLWPQFRDLITFGEATITFGEQVASADGRLWLAGVRADLEGMGYAVGAADLCSAGVGSPNIRQRLYWMAHAIAERHAQRHQPPGASRGRQGPRPASLRRSQLSRLAYANGGHAGAEGLQRGGQHGQQSEDCGSGGLAHSHGGRCDSRDGGQSEGQESEGRHGQPEQRGAIGGVGNTDLAGSQGRDERGDSADEWTPWSASVGLPCTDGRTRRIEPGSFPLAHGVSGRVGLLRGYGNAIVPWLAAEFILACEEAKTPAPSR